MSRPPPKALRRTGLVEITDNLKPGQQVRPDARLFNRLMEEDLAKALKKIGVDYDPTRLLGRPRPGR